MKKILSMIAAMLMLMSIIPTGIVAEYKFSPVFVDIEAENILSSTVFFDNEQPCFSVQLTNPESKSYNINLKYNMYDLSGTLVWNSAEESFLFDKKAIVVKSVTPKVNRYGVYTLKAVLTGEFGTIEKEISFAKAARNEKRDDYIGVQTHFSHDAYFGYEKEEISNYLIKNSGFGYIRDDHSWWQAETGKTEEKYVFPEYREKNIDYLISEGNKLLINVSALNPLYDDYTLVQSQDGIKAYAEFCAALAEYYKGRIDTFEICNEPDHEKYAKRDATGDEYAQILKAARDAIKNVDKNITVVGGALCSYLNVDNRKFLKQFADEIKKNGSPFDYMDVFSFHPYNNTGKYSDEEEDYTFLQNVGYVQEQLGKEIPIWISEYGVPNCELTSEQEWGYTDVQQASALVRTITAAKSESQITKFGIYNFRQKHMDSDPVEAGYGIVDGYYNAKPAYVALSYMNKVLKDAEYVGKLANNDYYSGIEVILGKQNRSFDAYRFKRGSEDIFVLWEHTGKTSMLNVLQSADGTTGISENNGNVTIKAGADKVIEIYDMYGNLKNETEVNLTDEPIYVVCRPQTKVLRDGNILYVEGYSNEPMTDITLFAVSNNSLDNKIIAIKQTKSNENRKYIFDTVIPAKGYYLYVAENGEKQSYIYKDDYEISAEYVVNDDKANICVKIKDNVESNKKLLLFGIVYEEHDYIKTIECNQIEWEKGQAVLNMELEKADQDMIKIMLWNEEQKPVSNSMVLGREG